MTLAIYVHLPFCRVHCTYCAFAISTDLGRENSYVGALVREIEAAGSDQQVATVYFGGGTPSRTSIENLQRVTTAIRRRFAVAPGIEFSMEANPEDVTEENIESWRQIGVNRLSIGVQSFADDELAPLGRIHGCVRAREAVSLAVSSGVRTNLDLIIGLPGQTRASFLETVETSTALGAGHISLYMLDLEAGSPLAVQIGRGRASLPDDAIVADLYVEAIARLEDAGLQQYEISNFARPGEECRHNLRYWTRGEYRGFGLGAHSFTGDRRFANTRNIQRYIASSPDSVEFSESLGGDEIRRELLFLGLRQAGGIDYEDVTRLCGQEGIAWMDRGLNDGWLRRAGGKVAFTPSGFLLSNDYISQLF